jgi:biopolymer transport protein ExbD
MPIYPPGKRDPRHRRNNHGMNSRRSSVTGLSLTSMVDMFTILVVFLLMNYSSTGEIIYIPKDVKLPKASQTKELKPAHIVTLTQTDVVLDKDTVAKLEDVKNLKKDDWMIPALRDHLVAALKLDDAKNKESQAIRQSLPGAPKPDGNKEAEPNNTRKITVQADRDQDFLTIKKVMFTVTEAGAEEINFAVMKKEDKPPGAPAN